jgi:acyl-homoserine lactone synthase
MGSVVIYVVDGRNRENYRRQLEEMHRIRHRIYVEGRGWKALRRSDGREVDEFDTENAVYLLGLSADGAVTAGSRLVPTQKPHLMHNVFPHLATKAPVPRSDFIYEWTRYFLTSEPADRSARRCASGEILCALFEYGLEAGLTHFSLVCDTFFLPMFRQARWRITELGDATPYEEGVCIAVLFEVSERVLKSTREVRGVSGPVLAFSKRPPPFHESLFDHIAA